MVTEESSRSESSSSSRPRGDVGDRALSWWRRLTSSDKGDPGSLARLRRARSPADVIAIATAVSLARRLGAATESAPDWRLRAALDLARVLSHVKGHAEGIHPIRAAGWKRFAGDRKESDAGDDRPVLSEVRFRRLLQVEDGEEKVTAFVRLVALLDGVVNVADLSRDFLSWNHPVFGPRIRERWAFYYYAAGQAAPPMDSESAVTLTEDDE